MSNSAESILIVDDHPMVAASMCALLDRLRPGVQVTIHNHGDAALAALRARDDWFRVFLDVDVPGAHGLSLARQFAASAAGARCVLVTAADKPQWQAEAASMGLLGYIVKSAPIERFVADLEAVLAGVAVFPPGAAAAAASAVHLTPRQKEVLHLLLRGFTSKRIAAELGLTTGTVHNHVAALSGALGVRNRAQLVAKAIELGYRSYD
jgi:DNA-binding NarL/FixJ family response regulator